MPVSTQHPDYSKYVSVWAQTRDAVKGSVAVKEKKHKYLPVPDNTSGDERKGTETVRYRQYMKRALYTNFTGRTKNALAGAAFRKDPIIELPEILEYLKGDATGDGLSLTQLAKDELSNILETGRSVLLVDYPQADDGLSAEEVARLDLKASIIPYACEQVINWKIDFIRGRRMITMIVIAENYLNTEDEFDHSKEIQYRVLRLSETGYSQQIYRENEPFTNQFFPRKGDGTLWQEIPIMFVGAKNNDSTIDDAPLADIAEINIAHFRNSADYEESCFIVGQPSLFITTSMSNEQFKSMNPQGIKLGSRTGHVLGETGSASLLQADPNQLVMEAMKAKEQQMVAIGARIITDRADRETAEAARIRFASENSVLGDVVGNLSEGIRKCIDWVGEFMNADTSDAYFEINREFYDKTVDPQMIMSMVTLLDRDIIGEQDIFDRLKGAGLVDQDRKMEDIKDEANQGNPIGRIPDDEELIVG
jgi:hypothetical protein